MRNASSLACAGGDVFMSTGCMLTIVAVHVIISRQRRICLYQQMDVFFMPCGSNVSERMCGMAGTSNGRQTAQSDAFSQFHPWVSFLYFALVLWFSMTLTHPVCQAESLLAGVLYALRLRRDHGLAFGVRYAAALILATAVLNPLFNHAGGTVLLYLPSGSALTLESILYGISSGTMLATLLIWFFRVVSPCNLKGSNDDLLLLSIRFQ